MSSSSASGLSAKAACFVPSMRKKSVYANIQHQYVNGDNNVLHQDNRMNDLSYSQIPAGYMQNCSNMPLPDCRLYLPDCSPPMPMPIQGLPANSYAFGPYPSGYLAYDQFFPPESNLLVHAPVSMYSPTITSPYAASVNGMGSPISQSNSMSAMHNLQAPSNTIPEQLSLDACRNKNKAENFVAATGNMAQRSYTGENVERKQIILTKNSRRRKKKCESVAADVKSDFAVGVNQISEFVNSNQSCVNKHPVFQKITLDKSLNSTNSKLTIVQVSDSKADNDDRCATSGSSDTVMNGTNTAALTKSQKQRLKKKMKLQHTKALKDGDKSDTSTNSSILCKNQKKEKEDEASNQEAGVGEATLKDNQRSAEIVSETPSTKAQGKTPARTSSDIHTVTLAPVYSTKISSSQISTAGTQISAKIHSESSITASIEVTEQSFTNNPVATTGLSRLWSDIASIVPVRNVLHSQKFSSEAAATDSANAGSVAIGANKSKKSRNSSGNKIYNNFLSNSGDTHNVVKSDASHLSPSTKNNSYSKLLESGGSVRNMQNDLNKHSGKGLKNNLNSGKGIKNNVNKSSVSSNTSSTGQSWTKNSRPMLTEAKIRNSPNEAEASTSAHSENTSARSSSANVHSLNKSTHSTSTNARVSHTDNVTDHSKIHKQRSFSAGTTSLLVRSATNDNIESVSKTDKYLKKQTLQGDTDIKEKKKRIRNRGARKQEEMGQQLKEAEVKPDVFLPVDDLLEFPGLSMQTTGQPQRQTTSFFSYKDMLSRTAPQGWPSIVPQQSSAGQVQRSTSAHSGKFQNTKGSSRSASRGREASAKEKPTKPVKKEERKYNQPISLNIADMLNPKPQHEKAVKPVASRKQDAVSYNVNSLDASAPTKRRGKERETPKAKKPSRLRKIILQERQSRRSLFTAEYRQERGRSLSEEHRTVEDDVRPQRSVSVDDLSRYWIPPTRVRSSAGALSAGCSEGSEASTEYLPSQEALHEALLAKVHSRKFREYCNQVRSKEINTCCVQLLKELVRFQKRVQQKDATKMKLKRRLVMGLHEVTKHLKLRKLKCVIISPNIERNKLAGGLDEALCTIIRLCEEQNIPFVFALNRVLLGQACSKRSPVSVVGIFNCDGANAYFNELCELTEKAREQYREMVEIVVSELKQEEISEQKFLADVSRYHQIADSSCETELLDLDAESSCETVRIDTESSCETVHLNAESSVRLDAKSSVHLGTDSSVCLDTDAESSYQADHYHQIADLSCDAESVLKEEADEETIDNHYLNTEIDTKGASETS